jgi:ribosomal protein S18 acetylase RimI-like enzyme
MAEARTTAVAITAMTLLPAHAEMASAASLLLHMSMKPLANYWMGVADSEAARAILEGLFRAKNNLFSLAFASYAEVENRVAGIELSYPASTMKTLELPTLLKFAGIAGLATCCRMVARSYPLQSITDAQTDDFFLAHLAVMPEFEGRGLGRRLLQHAEDKARAAGLRRITLTVDADNARAVNVYARAGFSVTGTSTFERLRRRFSYSGYHHMSKELR